MEKAWTATGCVCAFPAGGDRQRGRRGAEGGRPAVAALALSAVRQTPVSHIPPLPLPIARSLARCGRDALKTDSPTSRRPKDPPANGQSRGSDGTKTAACQKRALEDPEGVSDTLSKNKQKKRSRNPHKNFCSEQKRESSRRASSPQLECERDSLFSLHAAKYIKCEQCGNPKVGASGGRSISTLFGNAF